MNSDEKLLRQIDSGIQSLGDLFNKRMDAIEHQMPIEHQMFRRYAPLPLAHHCPKCGAALSQSVPDWIWDGYFGAWLHNCGGRSWGPRDLLTQHCARPDSEPMTAWAKDKL